MKAFRGYVTNALRKFAMNLNLKFHTPEEYFRGKLPFPYTFGDFDPIKYTTNTLSKASDLVAHVSELREPNIVLFIGPPAAGKSTFYRRYLETLGYERVNQDTLKTRDRCLKVAEEFLEKGQSICVDNTNADIVTRKYWFDLAKKRDSLVTGVLFTASISLCQHNNFTRSLGGLGPEKRTTLPREAFASFTRRYEEPKLQEGFAAVFDMDFVFQGTEDEQHLWTKWWT